MRGAAPSSALAGAWRQDPAQERGGDHQRDAGEEEHRPDRPLLREGEPLVVRAGRILAADELALRFGRFAGRTFGLFPGILRAERGRIRGSRGPARGRRVRVRVS
jgi:hypothetical protein